MKQPILHANRQSGVMLIEALIAILIFSIGVLGIIGLQGTAVKASTDSKYRSEAALLANELIGQMWASNRTQATLQAAYLSSNSVTFAADKTKICRANGGVNGVGYEQWAWQGRVVATPGTAAAPATGTVTNPLTLPGAMANPPTVLVEAINTTATPTSRVTIVICWQAPGTNELHNYVTTAQIGG